MPRLTAFLLLTSLSLPAPGFAQDGSDSPELLRLWRNGAPGFEDRKDEPETVEGWKTTNIHHPSLTVFRPNADVATGAAAVVVPGGGHRMLVFEAEGTEMGTFLARRGITAFVLKHRLPRQEGSPYDIDFHPKADGMRAMRWVRHHAQQYAIDPNRVGMMGFSAGGEVVSWVMYGENGAQPDAVDPIDRPSARPDFQVLVYPGPLGIPETFPANLPPAFMVVAADDGAADNLLAITGGYRKQKASVELHLYAAGGHGFNLGNRSKLQSIRTWTDRLGDWLVERGLGVPPQTP